MIPTDAIVRLLFLFAVLVTLNSCQNPSRIQSGIAATSSASR